MSKIADYYKLFIAHHPPKGLAVDEVSALGAERTTQMRVVEEGQT